MKIKLKLYIKLPYASQKAANKDTYILGTVGGFRGIKQEDISLQTILYHTEIQIDTLIEEGVDALLFETYYDLEELTNVISRTRKKYDIPIIAQLTASNTNYLVNGQAINEGLKQLVQCGANIVGLMSSWPTPYARVFHTY